MPDRRMFSLFEEMMNNTLSESVYTNITESILPSTATTTPKKLLDMLNYELYNNDKYSSLSNTQKIDMLDLFERIILSLREGEDA